MYRYERYVLQITCQSPHEYNNRTDFRFLTWLFTTYGDIDHDTIKEEEDHVSKIVYDLRNPITDVFEPMQELEQLAIAGNRPYTQAQLVDFGVAGIPTHARLWNDTSELAQSNAPKPDMDTAQNQLHDCT